MNKKTVSASGNFYKINKRYSITLNPIDKYQFVSKMGNRFNTFRNFVYGEALAIKYKYEWFIEISEPHEFKKQGYYGPRLHIHGYMEFRNKKELAEFLLFGYYKLTRWASVDIDTIEDNKIWYDYCTKQKLFKKNRLSNFQSIVSITEGGGGTNTASEASGELGGRKAHRRS